MQTMIIVQPSLINSHTFVSIIHMLYIFSAYCPTLAIKLLKMNITETLVCLLTGSVEGKFPTKKSITYKSAALPTNEILNNVTSIQQTNNIELISRTPQELYEIVSLIGEMMPRLPLDEPLFQVDQLFRFGKGYDANANGYVLWHWQDDQGQLRPYSFQDSRTIEHAWQQHEEEVQLVISGRHYLLDLQQLQQINEETNQARFIKRIVTPISPDITEPTSPSPSLSTDESTTTQPVQTIATTTINNSIDPRQEILKDNIELYHSFIQSLFTILYEVYNTSAGPAVKHRCLQSLLRMIYYSSSDLLETILKQQSISSHIASMLASSDYKIVISALQISEILMKKLPEVFSVYFYREGVVHQIEILIGFGITSSLNISISRTNQNPTSQSQLDLVHINENSSIPTIPTLSESFDEQQVHSYSNDPPPTHRGAATQLHPKTQSFPYRGSMLSRRYQTETNPTKIETRSQRGRILPTTSSSSSSSSSNSRIKTSSRSMFDEMTSSISPETSSVPAGRPRPTRGGTNSSLFRPTTFDPSPYYPLPTGSRPRPSTPIYVPSPYTQQPPYAYASSAPAAASLMLSTSMTTSVIQQQQQSQVPLSSQDKSKLKEWIQNQAQNFRTTYFSNNSSTSNIALQIINRLASAVDILQVGKDNLENTKALRDIANIIAKGDVTPFEMVHSGLITKLFQYLTDDISVSNDRLERLKLFLNIFINLPCDNKDDDDKDLKQFIIELHHTQSHNGKSNSNILSHLINKLHGCINQLEQFPIRGKSIHLMIFSFYPLFFLFV
jgi:E3 ubiquitin-protein ligase TRIP12